jgi:GTP-binding protein
MWDDYHKEAMTGQNVITEDGWDDFDGDWDDDDDEDDGHVIYVRE